MANKEKEVAEEVKTTYTKEQLYNSKRFKECKDIIDALLEKDKEYSIEEVKKIIETFRRKVVE